MDKTLRLAVVLIFSLYTSAQTMQVGMTMQPAPAAGNTFTLNRYCALDGAVKTTGATFTSATCNVSGAKLLILHLANLVPANTDVVSSSPANTWTCSTKTGTGSQSATAICYVISPTTSSSMTFSVQTTGATTRVGLGVVALNDTGTPTLDGTIIGGTSSGAALTVSPGSKTPAGNNEYVFTAYTGNGVGNAAATIGGTGSFVVQSTTSTNIDAAFADWFQTTASVANPTWTGPDQQVSAQIAVFAP